jgi:N-acyl-L-homoserine lactone synthetase
MDLLYITLEDRLTEAMESLRTRVFRERNPHLECSRDLDDDDSSIHVTAAIDGQPIGMMRVTRDPRRLVEAWHVVGEMPSTTDAIALSRFVIDRKHRGVELMRLLVFASLMCAEGLGRDCAIASVEKRALTAFLARTGWERLSATAEVDLYGERVSARFLDRRS